MKIYHIFDKVYRVNIYISYGHTKEQFIKDVKRIAHKDIELHAQATGHLHCFDVDDVTIYWIWTKKKEIPVLAHEILHCVGYVLGDRNVNWTDNNQEAYCYYMQFLFKEILKSDKKGGK